MRPAALWGLILPLALTRCSLAYLTEHAGDVGTGDGASSGTARDGASGVGEGTAGEGSHAGSGCDKPSCVVANNGCPEGNSSQGFAYYLYDNQWNCGPASGHSCGPEMLYGCSSSIWYVTSNQPAGNTAVLTYPDVQANFTNSPLVSTLHTLTSTFAEQSPHVGNYEVSYDIWLNGHANQVMIWLENANRTPSGAKVATNVSLGGTTYDVWSEPSSGLVTFYPNATFSSGTVDLLPMFKWAIQQNLLPANSTLNQITLGVEIVSTNGQEATWYFNDFSVTAH